MCFVCNHRTLFLCEPFINLQVSCQKYDGFFFRTKYSGDPASSHHALISNFIIIDKSAKVQASFGTIFDQLLCQSKSIFLSNRLKLYFFTTLRIIAGIIMHLAPEGYAAQFQCAETLQSSFGDLLICCMYNIFYFSFQMGLYITIKLS